MIKMSDFSFDDCYKLSFKYFEDELSINVIHYNHLIDAKKKAGRGKDEDDIMHL